MKTYLTYIAILASLFQNCASKKYQSEQVALTKYEFIDSVIYQPEKRILVGIFSDEKSRTVSIHLLQRSDKGLTILQCIDSLYSHFGDTTPVFEDLNQDGLTDVKLVIGSGSRGANVFYHVLVQETTNRLLYIRGADHIPNVMYDSTERAITGAYFYAGVSFVDYELENDTLIEISGTDVSADSIWTVREHYKLDANKAKVVVNRDSIKDGGVGLYQRYE